MIIFYRKLKKLLNFLTNFSTLDKNFPKTDLLIYDLNAYINRTLIKMMDHPKGKMCSQCTVDNCYKYYPLVLGEDKKCIGIKRRVAALLANAVMHPYSPRTQTRTELELQTWDHIHSYGGNHFTILAPGLIVEFLSQSSMCDNL